MPKVDHITVTCYGKKQEWASRQEAIDFYLQGVMACDGAERERYLEIYLRLSMGCTKITFY